MKSPDGAQYVPASKDQKVLSAEELLAGVGLRGPDDRLRIKGQVIAVLKNEKTGEKRTLVTHNIITNEGDVYYALKAAGEAAHFAVAGIRIGTNAGVAASPLKTDVKMETTTGSAVGTTKAIDGGYPKSNDDDTDNTGAGTKVVTWRVSFTTAQANHVDIATIDLPDSLTGGSITKSLSIANFGTKFTKTALDTLKVFINHAFAGV